MAEKPCNWIKTEPRMRRLLLTIVVVAVSRVAVCAQTAASSDVALAQQVAREITEVKGGTTPAEWMHAHADERLEMYNGPQLANDTKRWCARTVVAHPATAGRAWMRSVYFYDPQPPADDALPAPGASGKDVFETNCHLGLMWIDIPDGNQAVGTQLAGGIGGFVGGFLPSGWAADAASGAIALPVGAVAGAIANPGFGGNSASSGSGGPGGSPGGPGGSGGSGTSSGPGGSPGGAGGSTAGRKI